MKHITSHMRWFIVWFSEALWLYYTLVLFTGNQWSQGVLSDGIWWLTAVILGYAVNTILAGRTHYVVQCAAGVIVLGIILFQNWKDAVPEGAWGYGLALSIAVGLAFIRGASFVYKAPTRSHMLRRFEGNIGFYLLYVLIFSVNDWLDEPFHFLFLFAIFMSLMGMILTLQNGETSAEHTEAEIRTVGQSGWFTGVIGLLTIGITLLCLFLLLPSIRRGLHTFTLSVWEGLTWLASIVAEAILWLLRLLPEPEPGEGLPPQLAPGNINVPEAGKEEAMSVIPASWLIGGLIVIGMGIAIAALIRFLKHWQPPKASIKVNRIVITREPWWANLQRKWKAFYGRMQRTWRMRFPRFYHSAVYWHFRQLQAWGKRNGLARLRSETSRDYVEKLIRHMPEQENTFTYKDRIYHLPDLLRQLNHAYQAAYYGDQKEASAPEAQLLLHRLQEIRLGSHGSR